MAVGSVQRQQCNNGSGVSSERVSVRVGGEPAHDFDARTQAHSLLVARVALLRANTRTIPNTRRRRRRRQRRALLSTQRSDFDRRHRPQSHRSFSAVRRTGRSGPPNTTTEFYISSRQHRDSAGHTCNARWQHRTARPGGRSLSAGELSSTGFFSQLTDLNDRRDILERQRQASCSVVSTKQVDTYVKLYSERPQQ